MKDIGTIPTLVLKLAGLGDVADKINADLADGKISIEEGVDIAETIAPHIAQYLPGQAATVAASADLLATALECEHKIAPKIEALSAAIKADAAK